MKSRLFGSFDPEAEDNRLLERHLDVFLGLSDAQRDAFMRALTDFRLAQTEFARRPVLEKVEKETGCSPLVVTQTFYLLRFFLDQMQKEETRSDSPPLWSEDLIELGLLPASRAATFTSCVNRIREEVLPKVEPIVKQRGYATGVFPSLEQCGVTVEMRAVQENKYHWGTPISTYCPEVVDIVGVASIHIGVDRGEDYCFQADETELQLLIDSLVAAKADLQALRQAIVFSPKGNAECRR